MKFRKCRSPGTAMSGPADEAGAEGCEQARD